MANKNGNKGKIAKKLIAIILVAAMILSVAATLIFTLISLLNK